MKPTCEQTLIRGALAELILEAWQLGIQEKIPSPILRQILTNIDFAIVEEIRHETN
jgi:hypothetical protein